MKNTKFYYLVLMVMCQICSMVAAPVGTLTPVPGSPFPTGVGPSSPLSVAYSPIVNGNLFAAVANSSDDTVSRWLVDQTTGTFTQLLPDTATGTSPSDIAFSPVVAGGLFAAVANATTDNVSVYDVDENTGAFTLIQTIAAGDGPIAIAYSPIIAGNLYAAVTNGNTNNISVYSVDQNTGLFTQVPGSPFAVTGVLPLPFDIKFSPVVGGKLYAAVSNQNTNTVSVYEVDPLTGAFTEVPGSPFLVAVGAFLTHLDFSPLVAGNLFLAVNNGLLNLVSVYSVNLTTGFLTPVPGSPFATGTGPFGVDFSPVVAGTLFAAVANRLDNTVSIYTVNTTTGAFTRILPDTPTVGVGPFGIDFSPLTLAGKLFVANTNLISSDVSVFAVTLPVDMSAISQAIIAKYC